MFTILERFAVQPDKRMMIKLSEVVDLQLLKASDGRKAESDSEADLPIFKKQFMMKSLLFAADAVAQTFQPVDASMNALVYFFSKKGRLFEKHMRSRLELVEDPSIEVRSTLLLGTVMLTLLDCTYMRIH